MLTLFHPRPNELAPFKDGPLAPHLEGFALHLVRQRYSRCNGWLKLRLAAELSRWLTQHRVRLDSLGEEQTARFLRERWKQRPRRSGDRTTMKLVLQYLREGRMIPEARPPVARSSRDRLLAAYEQFLLQERGLAPGTVVLYRGLARRFLEHRFPEGRVVPAQLRAADIVK